MKRYGFAWKICAVLYLPLSLLILVQWACWSNDCSACSWQRTQRADRKRSWNELPRHEEIHVAEEIRSDPESQIWTEFLISLMRGNVMAVRTNRRSTSEIHSACVVEPMFECQNVGFSALLLATMEQLAYCHNTLRSTPTVMWRNCHAVCSKNPHFNSWNWYFEPVNPTVEAVARKVVCIAMVSAGSPVWLSASFRKRGLPDYNENYLITSETRRAANDIIQRYIRPNKNITRVVEELYITNLHGNNLLGVHVRGTDHISESKGHTLAPIKMWIEEARLILASIPAPNKIFIAGDNSEVLVAFLKEFGKDKVFFTKAFRAKSYTQAEAPHSYAGRTHSVDPKTFGSEVLIDTLLLAKCQHFLHAEASVAILATFFNPDMKSYFLGELSSKEGGVTHNAVVASREVSADSSYQRVLSDFDEVRETFEEHRKCFVQNSAASSCPNMAAGKFVRPSEVKAFFSPGQP